MEIKILVSRARRYERLLLAGKSRNEAINKCVEGLNFVGYGSCARVYGLDKYCVKFWKPLEWDKLPDDYEKEWTQLNNPTRTEIARAQKGEAIIGFNGHPKDVDVLSYFLGLEFRTELGTASVQKIIDATPSDNLAAYKALERLGDKFLITHKQNMGWDGDKPVYFDWV